MSSRDVPKLDRPGLASAEPKVNKCGVHVLCAADSDVCDYALRACQWCARIVVP